MTEEQQATLLARWLEDPSSPPPEGLDPEVIEALGVLRPDWVPSAAVTAEEILKRVTREPRVVDLEEVRSRRIPGWRFLGGISGAGAMAAAALAWFTVFPTSSWVDNDTPSDLWEEPAEAQMERTEDVTLSGASPEPEPTPMADALTIAEAEPPAEQALQAPPLPTRSSESGNTAVKDMRIATSPPSVGLAPAPPPLSQGSEKPAVRPLVRAMRKDSEQDEAMGSSGGSGSSRVARKSSRSAAGSVEEIRAPATLMEADLESVPVLLDTLRSRVLVHIGPMPTIGPEALPEVASIHEAKTALDQGQFELAEQHALSGLSLGSGPTAERRWLTFLVGESRRLRGDETTARERFEAALRGEVD